MSDGMRMRLLRTNLWIKKMMCREVKTAQLFTSGMSPHPEGLLSPIIFGSTPEEKSVMTGYIQLPTYFIHPEIYKAFFKRRYRQIDAIIGGTKKFIIGPDGDLIEDEKGNSGIEWFYKNFDKIKFKAQEVDEENDRIMSKNLKTAYNRLERSDVFIDKVLVCELILRDVNTTDGKLMKVDELNGLYQDIIRMCDMYSGDVNNMMINRDTIALRIQLKIVALLEYAFDRIFGKDGIQRKNVMGRKVDFTSRNIISATTFEGKFGSSVIDMDRAGYPLSAVVGSFTPMIMYNLRVFFQNCYDTGKIKNMSHDEFEAFYDYKYCKKILEKYIHSWGERFQYLPASGDKDKISFIEQEFIIHRDGKDEVITRPLTILEVLYIVAYNTIEKRDRVTSITRYPILNKYNNVITKIHVLSTHKTQSVMIDGVSYPFYPNIDKIQEVLSSHNPEEHEEIVGSMFHETIKMSNVFLPGFNADFDGDKLNNKSIFSEEATTECLANMERLSSIFTISDIMKFVTGEPQQAMYSLTIDPKEDARVVDRKYIDMIIQKDKGDFDPHFIFGALGMGRKTKSPPINRHYDIVILNKGDYPGIAEKTKTTLGRLLVNKIVWSHARLNYINENLVAKQIKKIFLSLRDFVLDNKLPIEDFKKTLQVFEDFGFRMSAFISPSMDANILKTNKELEAKKAELFEKYKKELNDNNVEVAVAVEKELIEYAKKLYTNEDYLEWYKAGSSSKMSYNNDFKVSKLMIGTIPKGIGTGEFYVSTSNFMDGIKKNEIHIMADQSIVALHAKTNETAVSGYLAKMGESMCQTVYLDKYGSDCKTKKYVEQYITPDIINEIFGMYTIDGEEINRSTIKKYIGKTIKMRNPYICEGSKICSKCAGNLIYKLENAIDNKRTIPIGLELKGILTELTQAALQKTHAMSISLSDIGDMNQYLSEF